MAVHDIITLNGEHGQYRTRVGALDIMIGHYLPASVLDLRGLIRERQGDLEYSVSTVTEGLMILAELDGYTADR